MSARLQTVQRESNQLQQQVNGKEREIVNLRKEMETSVQSKTPKDDITPLTVDGVGYLDGKAVKSS